MAKTCIRCGYERQESDTAPATECPKCGVIYDRVEVHHTAVTSAHAARSQQQIKLAVALRRRQNSESERGVGGFLSFGWMITPTLVRATFILAMLAIGATFVSAIASGRGWVAAGALGALLVVRLVLEGVMVVFRLAEDVSEIRDQLAEQAIEALRAKG